MKKLSTFLFVMMAFVMMPLDVNAQDYEVEAANIAAFNAVEDGKVVKLTLTNARVNAELYGTYYVEDATGATAVKGVTLTKGKLLNGYFIGKKATEDVDYVNTPSQGLEYSITVTPSLSSFEMTDAEMTGTAMTIAEACKQENYGKLVTLSNVSISPVGNGMNKMLTDASGSMRSRDLFAVFPLDYTWPKKADSFTGVLLYYMTGWFIMPISADGIVYNQPTEVTFDFSDTNTFKVGTAISDNSAWINNE
jgi:hypothetical protein